MAFASTVAWDVRTTGSDTNGGGFDGTSGTPGTDYSQQDAAQIAFADLVIDGTTNTKCTSAGNPFTSAHVGNLINITSGTGFTVQRVQIMSVTGSTATCDKSLGTLSSTGGHGNLGGSLATVPQASTLAVNCNTINVKTGTYTIVNQRIPANSTALIIRGYASTHGDGGSRPTFTVNADSVNVLLPGASSMLWLDNVIFDAAGHTGGYLAAISNNYGGTGLFLKNCQFKDWVQAVFGDSGIVSSWTYLTVFACEFSSAVHNNPVGITNGGGSLVVSYSYFHDMGPTVGGAGHGISMDRTTGSGVVLLYRNVFVAGGVAYGEDNSGSTNTVHPTYINGNVFYQQGYSHDNVSSITINARYLGQQFFGLENNIFWGGAGTTYGVNFLVAGTNIPMINRNNAYGNMLTANRYNFPVGTGDVALMGDPFANAAGLDFSLNSTSGAGAACRSVGYPGVFAAGLSTTGFGDLGAAQHQDAGGSVVVVNQNITRFIQEEG